MRVVVTGSQGMVGRAVVSELKSAGHHVIPLDRSPGPEVIRADLSGRRLKDRILSRLGKSPRWARSFAGADAVVHLAADPDPGGGYRSIVWNNVAGTRNVMHAAHAHGVEKVVFASSLHAVIGHIAGNPHRDMERNTGVVADTDVAYFPLSLYGASKAMGELNGKAAVARGEVRSFVAIRIGWYAPEEPEPGVPRTRWVSDTDLRRVFRAALEVPLPGFHVLYALSRCPETPADLGPTESLLARHAADGPP